MQYDPIKKSLGSVFNRTPFLRIVFYKLLDLLLLRSWHIHRELKKWDERGDKAIHIMDAGAGFGQYSYHLSKMGNAWNILSIDVKEEQVADCNTFFNRIGRNNVKFEIADLTKFVRENAFELILCVDVMEHIEDDVTVFENYQKSLKAGGMLLISTPSDQGGSDVHGDDETSFIEEHARDGYNIKEIEEKMLSAGFSKVYARYAYGKPGKISWRFSMKYPMLALNFSKAFFIILPFYFIITYPFCYILNYMDSRMVHETGTGLIVKGWK